MTDLKKNCRSCRHHSLSREERVLTREEVEKAGEWQGEDLDFAHEIGSTLVHDGSPEDDARYGARRYDEKFSCTKQSMKLIGQDDEAGVGCPMWEEGKKKAATQYPPHIMARMAALEAKGDE